MRIALLALGTMLFVGPAHADSFLCPRTGKYVETGDTSAMVLEKCGTPARREKLDTYRCPPERNCRKSQRAERWVYNLGSLSFMRYLLFIEDELAQIETGDYGKDR
jgi:hypothetical protein